jgi:hypothetical protein
MNYTQQAISIMKKENNPRIYKLKRYDCFVDAMIVSLIKLNFLYSTEIFLKLNQEIIINTRFIYSPSRYKNFIHTNINTL